MSKKNKIVKVEVKRKPISRGHTQHRSGSGEHNSNPKRQRTRQKIKEKWEKDET